LDTRFLETLLLVIERGSLADAARTLHITPAAVSQRIQTLENEIGHELLQRTGRTVRPTEQASAIIEHSRAILAQVADLSSIAANREEAAGKLRIGAIPTLLGGILPELFSEFFAKFPSIELNVVPGSSSHIYRLLQDEALDAAFIVEPPFELPKLYNWRKIRSEPLIVLAPLSETSNDPIEILMRLPFIRYDRGQWGGRTADAYLQRNDLHPREQLELDSLETIAMMVSAGVGASLVPDWVGPWPQGLRVRKIPLHGPVPSRTVGFLWSSMSPRARLIGRLLQTMDEIAGD